MLVDVRVIARKLLYEIANGTDPAIKQKIKETPNDHVPTVQECVDLYEPWVHTHRKGAASTMYILRSLAKTSFWNKPIDTITKSELLDWQSLMI